MRGFRKKDDEGNCDSRLQKKTEQIIRKPKSFGMIRISAFVVF